MYTRNKIKPKNFLSEPSCNDKKNKTLVKRIAMRYGLWIVSAPHAIAKVRTPIYIYIVRAHFWRVIPTNVPKPTAPSLAPTQIIISIM